MAIIKCKMCGGDIELSSDKTFGTCEYCGCTTTLPKIDDEQRAVAFNRGNHFRRAGEFDKALSVYERIVQEDDADAEAHWCCALSRFGIEYVEDPTTYEWMPTCHRASFDSFLEDVDYLAALEHSDGMTRRQYQRDAAKIAEVQRGILATCQNEEAFDVFICYKESENDGSRTKDSVMAQEIYYQLTEQGYRVFFSRITLEDKVGTQYEPYIFAALNSARVMIAVGTTPEHFNAVWVKNEWSRFLAMMRKDKHKLLLPCYRDMDPYDLPEALSVLQSYDMSKIGFVQDLIRGVKKVLDVEKITTPKSDTSTNSNENISGNALALLKRGNMALEDGLWSQADEFFEQVLNQNAECGEAYLGKFLVLHKVKDFPSYISGRLSMIQETKPETLSIEMQNEAEILQKYKLEEVLTETDIMQLLKFNRNYTSTVGLLKKLYKEIQNEMKEKSFLRAIQFADKELGQMLKSSQKQLFDSIEKYINIATDEKNEKIKNLKEKYRAHLEDAEQEISKKYQQLMEKAALIYESALEHMQNAKTKAAYLAVADEFTSVSYYKDSKYKGRLCKLYASKADDYERFMERKKKAKTAEEYRDVAEAFVSISEYFDSKEQEQECIKLAEDVLKQSQYTKYMEYKKNAQYAEEYRYAAEGFLSIEGYMDSKEQAQECIRLAEKTKKKRKKKTFCSYR